MAEQSTQRSVLVRKSGSVQADQKYQEKSTYTTSPRIMHMAESGHIAIIASKPSLQLTAIRVRDSFGHGERQAGASENMAAVDCADERVDEVQDIRRCVLGVTWSDAGGQ